MGSVSSAGFLVVALQSFNVVNPKKCCFISSPEVTEIQDGGKRNTPVSALATELTSGL